MSACILILVDESMAMNAPAPTGVAIPTAMPVQKSKAELVSTAVNVWLAKVSKLYGVKIALVGYASQAGGQADVGSRWNGALAGRLFVESGELAASPLRVERRQRRSPTGDTEVDFPVWYEATPHGNPCQLAAWDLCQQEIARLAGTESLEGCLIVNITSGSSHDGNPQQVIKTLQNQTVPQQTLIFNIHLASQTKMNALRPTLFPANRAFLSVGPMRDMFDRSSVIPKDLLATLDAQKVVVNNNARGMVYNAQLLEVTRALSIAAAFAEKHQSANNNAIQPAPSPVPAPAPAPEAETETETETELVPIPDTEPDTSPSPSDVTAEEPADCGIEWSTDNESWPISDTKPALIVFLLDRSLEDPFARNDNSEFRRLVSQMEEAVSHVAKLQSDAVHVSVVSYGLDGAGQDEIRTTLEGGLAGQQFARSSELESGALHIDEWVEERVSVGKIFEIRHRFLRLVEVEPSLQGSVVHAMNKVAALVNEWHQAHSEHEFPVLVVHLTRGQQPSSEMATAAQQLHSQCKSIPVALYHWVATTPPTPTFKYPDTEADLPTEELRTLWQVSTPLLGRQELSETRPTVRESSKGLVCNEQFDQLLFVVRKALDEA